jgi:alpha-tubulin suppressor-like RCC1 family protein
VACGFAYSCAVTSSGELYSWGAGENGRLGLGDVEDRLVPCKVDSDSFLDQRVASKLRCNLQSAMRALCFPAVFVCVCIRHTSHCTVTSYLCVLCTLYGVRCTAGVAAGSVHTCVLTEGGDMFSFGKCEYTGHGLRGEGTTTYWYYTRLYHHLLFFFSST